MTLEYHGTRHNHKLISLHNWCMLRHVYFTSVLSLQKNSQPMVIAIFTGHILLQAILSISYCYYLYYFHSEKMFRNKYFIAGSMIFQLLAIFNCVIVPFEDTNISYILTIFIIFGLFTYCDGFAENIDRQRLGKHVPTRNNGSCVLCGRML
jgi:hypothetical protein